MPDPSPVPPGAFNGALLIGDDEVHAGRRFTAVAAATGMELPGGFVCAEAEHVTEACRLADAAFDGLRRSSPERRATFLEQIATEIVALGDDLTDRACAETGLPRARIQGETGRTVGQLRAFARLLRGGASPGARIDPALPDRTPLPRPDLRQMRIGIGPVAVFGASNFPLAFSVAGGDTAAALAAGCPVVVRAHPAHPGTSELVGRAVLAAARACDMPEGVFSLLGGPDHAVGAALAADPHVAAIAFTGSRRGGLALAAIAASRPVPVPVFAEMSSINPVFLLPGALAARSEALAAGFVQSLSLGAGQFCTNPGLLVATEGAELAEFLRSAAALVRGVPQAVMLSGGIRDAFEAGVARWEAHPGVERVAASDAEACSGGCRAALFRTDARRFLDDPALSEEVFGAASLVVTCRNEAEMIAVATALEGQLTATLQLDAAADLSLARRLLPVLERRAGRILCNAWPTGVEVSAAMVHGGPFPATTDARTSSVGTVAIERFLRPVCFQDLPEALLPPELLDANPLNLPRLVDGQPVAGS
ncbi:aldehyde dehydrogenase (NADP(+)) [Rhizosaccharibacter radicis]|uniref:Aldehyde dehydrogenase (NADP(+)) n=1 Tax=Rhizosaccharibacter radicis TaxID=2782605 RepID=A0ABT1W1H5_9PROT|nr:aldehyde dehydrogenase (NADP(+)) [Acetobacteraceae bacterium KSS12]